MNAAELNSSYQCEQGNGGDVVSFNEAQLGKMFNQAEEMTEANKAMDAGESLEPGGNIQIAEGFKLTNEENIKPMTPEEINHIFDNMGVVKNVDALLTLSGKNIDKKNQ